MTARSFFIGAALLGALSLPLAAYAGISVTGKPKVSFFAEGSPGFLDIEGTTNTLTATDDGTTLTFTVPMDSVKTGIDTRDEHMNKTYVETGKYPNATLAAKKADIQWPAASGEKKTGTVSATFTVHGQAKTVTVSYTLTKSSSGYKVSGKFDFDASAHGIAIPSYLGVTVDPKMKAEVTAELADAP